ncbi:low molecular weight protein-tyrosine-phosphatase [Pseudonocardia nigra]|uniref:low molecular weight protein-tyrosine-phosphatase n=1 Tax=Pseudonocardia nigra TaxID=1921578 RepID=UPI001C60361F|nr:low molecular weight protein-tyrosine-phosphatase [Pseudonocardia nigra]
MIHEGTAYGGPVHVVFVCTGNICRSPIAEKVFVHELERAGLADRVRVTSAGTGGWHVGSPADDRAAALLKAEGYPDAHVARQVDAEQLGADLIVALDNSHRRALQAMVPEPDRVRLLRSFDPDAPPGAEVPDPYYGDEDGFGRVLAMIRAAMPGLLEWVREQP